MKRKCYSEQKFILILKEHEAGASVTHLSRRYGIAEDSVYRWQAKFCGLASAQGPRRWLATCPAAVSGGALSEVRLPDLARHAGHRR